MFCKNCGAELSNNQVFCPQCGSKNEAAMNQIPSNQTQGKAMSGQSFQGMGPTGQGAPRQMPPYQMPSGQVPPAQGQMPSGQTPPVQGQMPFGQIPPVQPSDMMPPYSPVSQIPAKKRIPLPVYFIISFVITILIALILITVFVLKSKPADDPVNPPSGSQGIAGSPTKAPQGVTSSPTLAPQTGNPDDFSYDMKYSYKELPEVVSLDSDHRFTYSNYTSNEDGCVYTYKFTGSGATQDDFYDYVDDYCSLLMTWNSYTHDEEYSNQMYYETGMLTDYFTKDGSYIGVAASVEDDGWYVYVMIFTVTPEEADPGSATGYEQYDNYIGQREFKNFDQYTENYMENGIAFYLNDITCSDQGDGTAIISCNMDLASTVDDLSIYPDDFLIWPYDAEGNVLSDLVQIDTIYDSNGYELSSYELDTEYFQSYTVTFVVPSEVATFSFFGSNLVSDNTSETGVSEAGPVYNCYVQLE